MNAETDTTFDPFKPSEPSASSEPSEPFDPFNPGPVDEKRELAALERSLRLAEQFTLIFARCNQPDERRRLITEIKTRLPEKKIQEIVFDSPIEHLLNRLREQITDPPPDTIFVRGLEHSLSALQQSGNTRFVANLNAARNSFGRYVPCPMVLWVPEYVLIAISRGAPDFFSVRSAIYSFDASLHTSTTEDTDVIVSRDDIDELFTSEEPPMPVSVEERERLDHLYALLAEARRLPADQRDPRMEIRLLNSIGKLALQKSLLQEAQVAFAESLSLATERGDRRAEALTLNDLGRVARNLALSQPDHYQELLRNSEELIRRSLILCRDLNYVEGEASALRELGRTLRNLNRLEDAEDAYRSSLKLFDTLDKLDRFLFRRESTLNHLGALLRELHRLDEARACHAEALAIYKRMGAEGIEGEAATLNYLGLVARKEGRYQEAEVDYKQSLQIRQWMNDLDGQAIVLKNLSALRTLQGDTPGARTFEQQLEVVRQSSGESYVKQVKHYGIEWIPIPAGNFLMGDDDMADNPRHIVYLDAYSISKYPITVKQYLTFCDITGHEKPEPPYFNPEWSKEDHPIVNVNWNDAMAYCKWMSEQTGLKVALPTEAQWEKAARGTDGRLYPWGNEWDSSRLQCSKTEWGDALGTAAIGSFPRGASPYGVLDMAGNVWEWCSDWYDKKYSISGLAHNPTGPGSGWSRVLRGGSWFVDDLYVFHCAYRSYDRPGYRKDNVGFRCVATGLR